MPVYTSQEIKIEKSRHILAIRLWRSIVNWKATFHTFCASPFLKLHLTLKFTGTVTAWVVEKLLIKFWFTDTNEENTAVARQLKILFLKTIEVPSNCLKFLHFKNTEI